MSSSAVFKCINVKCRNIALVESSLCPYCKDLPYGYTREELKQYGDLPFVETQRIMENERREREKALAYKMREERMKEERNRSGIILPPHFH